jgi:acyl carrier protein
MDTANIERDIRHFLVVQFLDGRAEDLLDDGALLGNVVDSTGVLELVGYLQDHFAITVEDDEVISENLDSLKTLVAYVGKKIQAKPQVRF